MSDGYYIYLDQRDVGKDNLNFSGWVNYNDGEPEHATSATKCDGSVPVFNYDHWIVFKNVYSADLTIRQIVDTYKNYPEIKEHLHIATCKGE